MPVRNSIRFKISLFKLERINEKRIVLWRFAEKCLHSRISLAMNLVFMTNNPRKKWQFQFQFWKRKSILIWNNRICRVAVTNGNLLPNNFGASAKIHGILLQNFKISSTTHKANSNSIRLYSVNREPKAVTAALTICQTDWRT